MADLQQLLKDKTPVSFLQEICSKKKLTASYDILANEGPVHEPVFVMRAQAGEFQGTGKGPSKKKAKHNAASQLLCNMHGIKCEVKEELGSPPKATEDSSSPSNGHTEDQQVHSGLYDGDMLGNPIGELQEYTQKNLMRPPIYEFIGEQGPPHAREFVCTVKLAKLQETAVGKSKKIAKRAAASKLLQSVRQRASDTANTAMLDEEEDELPLSQQSELKGKNIPALTAEGGKQAKEFFQGLQKSNKAPGCRALHSLHSTDLNAPADNFSKMLEDLGKERKFDVRYLDLSSKSYSGQYQCIVQLSTGPIIVCFGAGKTMEEAHTCAAHNALQYLKVMTADT